MSASAPCGPGLLTSTASLTSPSSSSLWPLCSSMEWLHAHNRQTKQAYQASNQRAGERVMCACVCMCVCACVCERKGERVSVCVRVCL